MGLEFLGVTTLTQTQAAQSRTTFFAGFEKPGKPKLSQRKDRVQSLTPFFL
jgi:hypothetical protein